MGSKIEQKVALPGVDRNARIKELVDSTFPDFDKNGNGYIDSDEIFLLTKTIFVLVTNNPDAQVDNTIVGKFKELIDTNKDGKISREEIQGFIRTFMGDLL